MSMDASMKNGGKKQMNGGGMTNGYHHHAPPKPDPPSRPRGKGPKSTTSLTDKRFVESGVNFNEHMDGYGKHRFTGSVAAPYLKAQGLSANALDDHSWTKTKSNQVAAAVAAWAKDNDASMFTHWFQPLGSSGLRHSQGGCVHLAMFAFDGNNNPIRIFEGKDLLRGETDGSSYMTGGLRATHTAGAYTVIDPSSPMFILNDCVYIPALLSSFHGDAIDEKVPLLRAQDAVDRESRRLLGHLGFKCDKVYAQSGLEQEFFLVPRNAYNKRPDLQFAGRTVMGRSPARGQEMSDHYMAPPNQLALKCLQEVQHQCFLLGISLTTRHREVAPNQYEASPLFGLASTRVDENLLLMMLIDEVASRHGLAALCNEKPFKGINGNGKHNNFSLGTEPEGGVNLMHGVQFQDASNNNTIFPVIMSCIISAVDLHGDLMRMGISSPGNDFRLGACEAPPAIISTYLGDELTKYMEVFKNTGEHHPYRPSRKTIDLGIQGVDPFKVPAEDRNRTSPFPIFGSQSGGHRFEFRACGGSQNMSMIDVVLCTAFADVFSTMSDHIEAGGDPIEKAQELLKEHWKVIFNGNGYSEEWKEEATKRGIWRIDSSVEAIERMRDEKNVDMFIRQKVLNKNELLARLNVMHDMYVGTVEIEARCMADMIRQHVIPCALKVKDRLPAGVMDKLNAAPGTLEAKLKEIEDVDDAGENPECQRARLSRVLRLETMEELREACDIAEGFVPPDEWTLGTYKDLLFFDTHNTPMVQPFAVQR